MKHLQLICVLLAAAPASAQTLPQTNPTGQAMTTTAQANASPANAALTKRLEVKGTTFAYREIGAGTGAPLVLVNRFRATMDDWDPELVDRLAAKRRVIVFDNVGVGLTSGETPASIPSMAASAIDFVEALGLRQVDLLGWSMGGMVSLAAAIAHPDRVRRIIVAGSSPAGVPNSPPAPAKVAEVATNPNSGLEGLLYLFFPATAEGRAAGMAHFGHMSENRRAEPAIPPNKPDVFRAQAIAIQTFRKSGGVYAQLAGLKHRVLLANGMHDVMMPAFDSFAAAQQLPNADLIIYPAAGHAFLFQYADRFANDVNAFLDRAD
jgi:pimeloyl-ACP methyl ester carboxylesterase